MAQLCSAPASAADGEEAAHKVHRLIWHRERAPAQLVGRDHRALKVAAEHLRGEVQRVKRLVRD